MAHPKKGTHDALLTEQGHVCAYCGKGPLTDRTDSHIDHFWPQSHFPDLALDYTNLYASCGPATERRAPRTCGDAKGNWFNPDNQDLFPSHPDCEYRFKYSGAGQVLPRRGEDSLARAVIKEFNLNDDILRVERRRVIAGLEEAVTGGEITAETISTEIEYWRSRIDGRHIPFGHVASRYLEDELI